MLMDEILQGESATVEFKEQLPEKSSKYMKTVVAFANGRGGRIYFGVRDVDHAVVGVAPGNLFRTMDAITTAIADSCEPTIFPDVSAMNIEGKQVIVVDIQAGRQRPYYLKSQGMMHGVYVRVSGTTRPADRNYIEELMLEDSHRYYDQLPADYEITASDIENLCNSLYKTAVENADRKSSSVDIRRINANTLLSWGVLAERSGKLVPTNAFSLLTGHYNLPCKVQCGVFRGSSRALLVGRQEFQGPIQKQVQDVYEYVLTKCGLRTEIRGLYRYDSYEFPKESLREAIVNAVVHRSYLEHSDITVFLYDDRLEITSPGGLLQTVTIERIKEGYSKVRNRALTDAFIYMNLIDQYGSGIPRILEEFRQEGLVEPQFVDMGADFRVIFKRRHIFDTNDTDDANTDTKGETINDTNATEDSIDEKICEIMQQDNEVTVNRLAERLHTSRSTVLRSIKRLKNNGLVQRIGDNRNGKWQVVNVKY
ncbi:RNA-binding domain-containing protein [Selenomonas ruminantium]|uniref:Predicted transcriptional regulator, contains HTH domain n=1 Tax=Selenomonas ruminantium TaxID=971 RepID=A0A1I0YNY0_SELRU|nr:RNA-binding domain-containing protein [Selenomonas ruminantium]SFB15034.1 Predicted transcriptional regulator, contains HTH domain [Selenomonas ruminantium]